MGRATQELLQGLSQKISEEKKDIGRITYCDGKPCRVVHSSVAERMTKDGVRYSYIVWGVEPI